MAPRESADQEHAQRACERRRESSRDLARSEGPERGRRQPVEERGFFEIRRAEEMRHDPVATHRHLAGNLGVATLVRVGERDVRGAEQEECQRQRRDDQNKRKAAAVQSAKGGSRAVVVWRHRSAGAQYPELAGVAICTGPKDVTEGEVSQFVKFSSITSCKAPGRSKTSQTVKR